MKVSIQVQCNVNKMFQLKKTHEINKASLKKDVKKKENIDVEIVKDKISILNELDKF